jgi:hypothetical protein
MKTETITYLQIMMMSTLVRFKAKLMLFVQPKSALAFTQIILILLLAQQETHRFFWAFGTKTIKSTIAATIILQNSQVIHYI